MQKVLFRVGVVLALVAVVWWLISKGGLDFVMILLMIALICLGIWSFVKWIS